MNTIDTAAHLALLTIALTLAAAACRVPVMPTPDPLEASPPQVSPTRERVTSISYGTEPSSEEKPSVTAPREMSPKPSPTSSPMRRLATRPPTVTRRKQPTDTPTQTPTKAPTQATSPPTHTPTPVVVADVRVVYHDGFSQDGVGVYERGGFPWLDLLVQVGPTWYGPERESGDGIDAVPLPAGYHWETGGSFGCLPNGEAWWAESGTEGTARLFGPDGALLVEVPLRVTFHSPVSDGDDSATGITPTPT